MIDVQNIDQPKEIEEGIDIAVEMLYDKMDGIKFLTDVAQMIKKHRITVDTQFDNTEEL